MIIYIMLDGGAPHRSAFVKCERWAVSRHTQV